MPNNKKNKTFIDLFCGAGGFALGFINAGYENIFSLDFDKSFSKTYKFNFPNHNLVVDDIKNLNSNQIDLLTQNKKTDIIIGGPPCQGFSIAGNLGRTFVDDPRNYLFKEFVRIVDIIKPKMFLMENVARLYNHNQGKTRNEIISAFENIGYEINCAKLDSFNYGVPQHRRRVFFLGSFSSLKNPFPEPKLSNKTIFDVIDDLPNLESGQKALIPANHESMNHTKQMLAKMKYVKNGGNRKDIPKSLRPKSGDIRKYIRYSSDKPSITITGDMRKVFHYSQNRALTVRELARIQTFPDNFIFHGSKISQQQQIGNAVPPKMAYRLAKHLLKFL
tara:strand:- start:3258 stop:4256 length:999 start_codon:yes stop_codon:yes gene_type:complete